MRKISVILLFISIYSEAQSTSITLLEKIVNNLPDKVYALNKELRKTVDESWVNFHKQSISKCSDCLNDGIIYANYSSSDENYYYCFDFENELYKIANSTFQFQVKVFRYADTILLGISYNIDAHSVRDQCYVGFFLYEEEKYISMLPEIFYGFNFLAYGFSNEFHELYRQIFKVDLYNSDKFDKTLLFTFLISDTVIITKDFNDLDIMLDDVDDDSIYFRFSQVLGQEFIDTGYFP